MSGSMPKNRDIRTLGYVLRRTNYAEADRILNLITPLGKMSVMAKGVRKERSKLAGGVEMFSLTDYNIHLGRGEFGVVTGAKMIRYYTRIVCDLTRMEIAAMILKRINVASESSDSEEYFRLVDESLAGLNDGLDVKLIEAWFLLNLTKVMGEEINLYRDKDGKKLESERKYRWDQMEKVFVLDERGGYGENEIKMLRLMSTNGISVVRRVKIDDELLDKMLFVARVVSGM